MWNELDSAHKSLINTSLLQTTRLSVFYALKIKINTAIYVQNDASNSFWFRFDHTSSKCLIKYVEFVVLLSKDTAMPKLSL